MEFCPSSVTADAVQNTQSWHELLLKLLERLQCEEWCYSSRVLPAAPSAVSPVIFTAVNAITRSAKQFTAGGVEMLSDYSFKWSFLRHCVNLHGVMAMWLELALTSESGTSSEIYRGFYIGIMYGHSR